MVIVWARISTKHKHQRHSLRARGGAWMPSFERAKQACETDAQQSLRQRIAAKVQKARKAR